MRKYILLSTAALVLMSWRVNAEIVTGSPETENGCGENCSWSFDTATGVLTISGSGKMDDYGPKSVFVAGSGEVDEFLNMRPYQAYASSIKSVVVSDGITYIGNRAFEYFKNVKTITLGDSVSILGTHTMSHNTKLETSTISSSIEDYGRSPFNSDSKLANVYCSVLKKDLCQKMAPDATLTLYQKNTDGSMAYYNEEGHLKTIRGKKIYTVEEAEAVTANGDKFHVKLTYK